MLWIFLSCLWGASGVAVNGFGQLWAHDADFIGRDSHDGAILTVKVENIAMPIALEVAVRPPQFGNFCKAWTGNVSQWMEKYGIQGAEYQ